MMSSLMQVELSREGRIRHYILLLAGAEDDAIRNSATLQKLLYTVAKETGDGDMEASFEPSEYGPYSEQASDELDRLSRDGLVSQTQGRIAPTKAGRAAAQDVLKGLDEYTHAVITGYRPFLNSLTDEQLLLYIHLLYPSMSEKSRTCAGLVQRAEGIVMDMVRDGKISSGRAAEVLKIPFHDVLPMMKKHGIVNLY